MGDIVKYFNLQFQAQKLTQRLLANVFINMQSIITTVCTCTIQWMPSLIDDECQNAYMYMHVHVAQGPTHYSLASYM